jgi:hypothetical protein
MLRAVFKAKCNNLPMSVLNLFGHSCPGKKAGVFVPGNYFQPCLNVDEFYRNELLDDTSQDDTR